jgi:hypothetical protein
MTDANQKIFRTINLCRENGCLPNGRRNCALCGQLPAASDEPFLVGLYIPDKEDQKRIGATAGRSRVVIYLLCWTCFELSDSHEKVAERVIRVAGVQ